MRDFGPMLYLVVLTTACATGDLVIGRDKGRKVELDVVNQAQPTDTANERPPVNVLGKSVHNNRKGNRPVQSKDTRYAENDKGEVKVDRSPVKEHDTQSNIGQGSTKASNNRAKKFPSKVKPVGAMLIHKARNKIADDKNYIAGDINKSFLVPGAPNAQPNNPNSQNAKQSVINNGQNQFIHVPPQPVMNSDQENVDKQLVDKQHAELRADQPPDGVDIAKQQQQQPPPPEKQIYDRRNQEHGQPDIQQRQQETAQHLPQGQQEQVQGEQKVLHVRQRQEQDAEQLPQNRQHENKDSEQNQQQVQQDRLAVGPRLDEEQRRLKEDGQPQGIKRQQEPGHQREDQRAQEEYPSRERERKEGDQAWQRQRQEEFNKAQEERRRLDRQQELQREEDRRLEERRQAEKDGQQQEIKLGVDGNRILRVNDGNSAGGQRTEHSYRLSDQSPVGQAQVKWDGDDFALTFGDNVYMEQKVRRASVPTAGQPWPMPQYYKVRNNRVFRVKENFSFNIVEKTCDIIEEAVKRYRKYILEYSLQDMHDNLEYAAGGDFEGEHLKYQDVPFTNATDLEMMKIRIRTACVKFPSEDMDESYTLVVKRSKMYLAANEVWGAVRALETLSQLIFKGTNGQLYIREILVNDYPRFTHRGVLIDTSRHYIYKEVLYDVLESMAQNKLNVMHWHIVDDQSFPYESKVFPDLSKRGAFHPEMVYTHEDITDIIEYARLRGIRVMPEFDTPGHTYAWGLGYPDLLTQCYSGAFPVKGYLGPLNPASNFTYDFLKTLYREILSVFKEKYIHLGGDETPLACWISNPSILAFSEKIGGYGDTRKLMEYYQTKLLKVIESLAHKRHTGVRTVVWQDVLDTIDQLPERVIVNVWRGGMTDVQRAASLGHHVIYSTCWYLDLIEYGSRWYKYYLCDPAEGSTGHIDERMVLGGEAALWAEYIDNENLMTTLWPRASATAERLWSNKDQRDVQEAGRRLIEHRCRMLGRGLSVSQISGPDYCPSRGPRKLISAGQLMEDREEARKQASKQPDSSGKKVNIDASQIEMEQFDVRIGGGAAPALKINRHCGSWAAGTSVMPQGNAWLILILTLVIVLAILFHLRHNSNGHVTHRILKNKTILFSFVTLLVIYVTCYTTIWLQVLDVKSSFLRVQDSPGGRNNPENIVNS